MSEYLGMLLKKESFVNMNSWTKYYGSMIFIFVSLSMQVKASEISDFCQKYIDFEGIAFKDAWKLNGGKFVFDNSKESIISYRKESENKFILKTAGDVRKSGRKQLDVTQDHNKMILVDCDLSDENEPTDNCFQHTFEWVNGKCFPIDERRLNKDAAFIPKFNLSFCAKITKESSYTDTVAMLKQINARGTRIEDVRSHQADPEKWKTPVAERTNILLESCRYDNLPSTLEEYKKALSTLDNSKKKPTFPNTGRR